MSSKSLDKRHPLSPELSERLKPDKDRHYSNRDHHDFQRRRHHRRANKRGRRHRPRGTADRSPILTSQGHDNSGGEGASKVNTSRNGSDLARRPNPSSKNLVLRPTKGPLLNAPKNSTQFIIDDHETSPFLDDDVDMSSSGTEQEISPKKYNTRSRQASTSGSGSRRVSVSGELSPHRSPEKTVAASTTSSVATTVAAASQLVTSSSTNSSVHEVTGTENSSTKSVKDGQATPGNCIVNDDDYTLWAEFSERDFQTVYESAHQEQVADWDRHRLIEEITNLEKRQKELVNILARVDPEMAAQRLQDQLEALQEKNRQLRSANGLSPNPVRPDSGIQNPGIQQQNPELALEEDSVDSEVMIVTSKSQPSPRESPDSSTKE